MKRVAIVSPVRTAVGSYGGSLRPMQSEKLGSHIIKALMTRTGIDPNLIDDVVFAQAYPSGEAPAMGRWMARAGTEILSEADLITPVPLHRVRLWRRRFNQAAVLAGHVARHARLPCETGLIERIKATRPQVGLTREERASNLQGAFRLTPEAAGLAVERRIVLIDDVLTTGATLNACARALLKAGAARVDALTFARVVSGA